MKSHLKSFCCINIPLFALMSLVFFGVANAERSSFDENWKFQLGDVVGQEHVRLNDTEWRVLDLPHDWSIEGEYHESNPMGMECGYLPAGIAWYRKTIAVDPAWKGKHVEIALDGVFMNSTVWANGKKLGTRPYGWISFAYDISEVVDVSDEITFAVRVDNEKQPAARWYTGSGIYAHTWLDVTDNVHVVNDGIVIQTKGNSVSLEAEISNTSKASEKVDVVVTVKGPDGTRVARGKQQVKIGRRDHSTSHFEFEITNPQLWSVETPNLYTASIEVLRNGKTVDQEDERFGIRDIEWIPETGMWINGENVKLRGVCNHLDAGPIGTAVPDKVIRYRLQQLKDMGCNAIRTSHYPRTPVFYDLCDEMGMMVMDEIFDGWYQKAKNDYGAQAFEEWWQTDLRDWLRRDRNHPSVVIWSVGNETKGEDMGKKLVEFCHEIDPTRPVTSGHSAHEVMDVFGANGGSEAEGFFEHLETDRVFIGTENTHTFQTRGYYKTKTWYRDGYPSKRSNPHFYPDLTEEEVFTYDWILDKDRLHPRMRYFSGYDNAIVRLSSRHNVELLRDIPNFAGTFRWVGYDYIGEAKYHGGWPFRSFSGGALDLCSFEKDLYYMYQSQWTEKPMVHILPHWTHPTLELGIEIPVQVYSNCDEVELFFNGKSLGRQQPGAAWDKMACQWMVAWSPGELRTVGYQKGKKVVEEKIHTAGAPAQIELSVDGEALAATGKDIVQVRATVQDKAGHFYPYGENRTWFHIIGSGRMKALGNGNPVDRESHFGTDNRNGFFGLTAAFIEATEEVGDVAVLASSILGEKKLTFTNKISIDTDLLVLRGEKPHAKIDVYYTLDGSQPSQKSKRYKGAFAVKLGTTVKALVVMNGKPVQHLEERFSADVGMVWDSGETTTSADAGDQAETAAFEGAKVLSIGLGYHGKGYLYFDESTPAFVEWYHENDGDSGEGELRIRSSCKLKGVPGIYVRVTVNGKLVNDSLLLRNTQGSGNDWRTTALPIVIDRGANSVRIEPINGDGLCLDEIVID